MTEPTQPEPTVPEPDGDEIADAEAETEAEG